MHLKIRPFNATARELYENHGHFHDGDAGIDLFVINEQTIIAGESTFIHLHIACENRENKPYLVMPRSSIAKTPLRLSNSIGLIDGGVAGSLNMYMPYIGISHLVSVRSVSIFTYII